MWEIWESKLTRYRTRCEVLEKQIEQLEEELLEERRRRLRAESLVSEFKAIFGAMMKRRRSNERH